MSKLKHEPPLPVRSLGEIFAIAHALGHEAVTRYEEIADRMRSAGKLTLAELFDRFVAQERSNLESVSVWSARESGGVPDPALVRWRIPDIFDDEGMSTIDPHLVSTYRALSVAVRNEERTFVFWSYVVAHAQDPDVRKAAERMAGEELRHAARLRRERRQAYHAGRSVDPGQVRIIHEMSDLERGLADRLDVVATAASPVKAPILSRFANEARATAEELARQPLPVPGGRVWEDFPEEIVALSELLVDRYLEAAEGVTDQQSNLRAQILAGRAITRLDWLRNELPKPEL
jgi:rubrerythrin